MITDRYLLDHIEKVQETYVGLVDKAPTEDKVIMAREMEEEGLAPWEISEIVQAALNDLPEGLEEHMDSLFDVVYEAISKSLDRLRS